MGRGIYAEYYQPKYDQAEKFIKNCGFQSENLGSLIEPIQNGFDYREYTEDISSEIMLVRLNSIYKETILPEYVSLFLNSKFGYLQVERRVHGVAYYSISQPDLANLLIPILPRNQQQKIVENIKSSFSLKLKSKQLLEIAKIGVEKAIETDEATATAWINQQLAALGINSLDE